MIPSEYYQAWRGPTLSKSTLDTKDITNEMKLLYGPNKNWMGNMRTFREVFGKDSEGKSYQFQFVSECGQEHWFNGFIFDIDQLFNPPRKGHP
jgi:hypothetical protein|tara:strand:+ start:260 stop:538 length:279 start_codon:yes stop_codon:yes gene_type:complete